MMLSNPVRLGNAYFGCRGADIVIGLHLAPKQMPGKGLWKVPQGKAQVISGQFAAAFLVTLKHGNLVAGTAVSQHMEIVLVIDEE